MHLKSKKTVIGRFSFQRNSVHLKVLLAKWENTAIASNKNCVVLTKIELV